MVEQSAQVTHGTYSSLKCIVQAIDLVVFVRRTRSARILKDGRFREDTGGRSSGPFPAANERAQTNQYP